MTTVKYELTTRQVVPSTSLVTKSKRVEFDKLDMSKGYFYRLKMEFNSPDSSMKFDIDFSFDNTEDYLEEDVVEEENNVKRYVGRQRKLESYHIRYGEEIDSGICHINIFAKLATMIRQESKYESPVRTTNGFCPESFNGVISGLTYSNKEIMYTDNKFTYSVEMNEDNKVKFANVFNQIDEEIKAMFYLERLNQIGS